MQNCCQLFLQLSANICITSAPSVNVTKQRALLDLERYFCRELGFTLLVLAAAAVLGLSANGDDTKIALGFGPQGLENPNPSSSKG